MAYLHAVPGAVPFALCLLPAHWDDGITIVPGFSTLIAEARTGIESRAPDQEDMRHVLTVSYQLSASEAIELRTALLTLGDMRVGIPLWMDDAPAAAYAAQRVFASVKTVNHDPATGEFVLDASAPFSRTTGLLIGRLRSRPRLRALDQRNSIVTISVIEDCPFEYRIDANALPMPAWNLNPDWSESLEDFTRDRIRMEDIGQGREAAINGQESATRRGQSAGFSLDRDETRKLLGFFSSKKGSLSSFALPLWYQPGGLQTITARFADDKLTLRWVTPRLVRTSIEFIEEVPLVPGSPAQEQSGRAWLYKFTFEGAAPQYFTSYAKALVLGGNTYEPRKIEHSSFVQSTRPQGDEMEITSDSFAGCPLLPIAKLELERKLTLTVYECNPANPAAAVMIFLGNVLSAKTSGRRIVGSATTLGGALRRKIPRFRCQRTCNYTLYDELCGVSAAANTVAGVIAAINGTAIDVTCGDANDADWFANGWATFGAGATAERRAILRSQPIGGGQRLTIHKPITVAIGAAASLLPGCDGQYEGGCAKFANQERFGGSPRQPPYIEAAANSFKPSIGK